MVYIGRRLQCRLYILQVRSEAVWEQRNVKCEIFYESEENQDLYPGSNAFNSFARKTSWSLFALDQIQLSNCSLCCTLLSQHYLFIQFVFVFVFVLAILFVFVFVFVFADQIQLSNAAHCTLLSQHYLSIFYQKTICPQLMQLGQFVHLEDSLFIKTESFHLYI